MPPKNQYSCEDIVDAAFRVSLTSGFSAVTARSVSHELGASVAPIYVHFNSIDELLDSVILKVVSLSREILEQQKGESSFYRIITAGICFSQKYPVIAKEIMLQPKKYMLSYKKLEKKMVHLLAEEDEFSNYSPEQLQKIYFSIRLIQTGLNISLANGYYPDWFNADKAADYLKDIVLHFPACK